MRLFEQPHILEIAHYSPDRRRAKARRVGKTICNGFGTDRFASDKMFVNYCREDGLPSGIRVGLGISNPQVWVAGRHFDMACLAETAKRGMLPLPEISFNARNCQYLLEERW